MVILRDLSVLWSLVHVLAVFILLYRPRYSGRVTAAATTVFFVPLAVTVMAVLVYQGPEMASKLIVPLCTVPSVIFFYIMSADRGGRFFFTFCVSDTVSLWIIDVTNLLDTYLGGGMYVVMFVSRLVLFPLLEFVIWRYLRQGYHLVQSALPGGWWVFVLTGVVYYALLVVMANYPSLVTKRADDLLAFVLVLALMPLMYLTIFATLSKQLQLFNARQKQQHMQAQKERLELLLENQQLTHRLHHDMKAHVSTLSSLLAEGKLTEARDYLARVGDLPGALLAPCCDDPYINAAINAFRPRFAQLGVQLSLDIRLSQLCEEPVALCMIIANALENALEALAALPAEARAAGLWLHSREPYLLLRVKNRCAPGLKVSRGERPATSKEGPEHGHGLATIWDMAKRLGGSAACYTENGFFVLEVAVKSAGAKAHSVDPDSL